MGKCGLPVPLVQGRNLAVTSVEGGGFDTEMVAGSTGGPGAVQTGGGA